MTEPLTTGPVEGRRLCGAVHVRIEHVDDARLGACHCRMCQRRSEALFVCLASPAETVDAAGKAARHASSNFAEPAFHPTCVSHLRMRDTSAPDPDHELMPGLFDAARDRSLQSEICSDRALAAVRLVGDHRRTTRTEWEAEHPFVEGVG